MRQTLLVGLLLAVGGCATSYEELTDIYDKDCVGEARHSEVCEEMEERLIRIEDRRLRVRREKEEETALVAYCKAQGLVLYCESRSMDKRCQCASTEAIRDALF